MLSYIQYTPIRSKLQQLYFNTFWVHYLVNSLIKKLHVTAEHMLAYTTIQERYYSICRLTLMNVNKIIDLRNVTLTSITGGFHCQSKYSVVECTEVLRKKWNPLFTTLFLRKRGWSTVCKMLEASGGANQEMPYVSDIIKFLTDEWTTSEDVSTHPDEDVREYLAIHRGIQFWNPAVFTEWDWHSIEKILESISGGLCSVAVIQWLEMIITLNFLYQHP